ncbi:MAG TPA: hypothetical protein DDY70_05645 [Clostridiales bacterium]|nr:hypothetical protein [Clostridiales bacterium]
MNNETPVSDSSSLSRTEITLAVFLGCFNMLLLAVLTALSDVPLYFSAPAAVALYLCEIALLGFRKKIYARVAPDEGIAKLLEERGITVLKNTQYPVFIFNAGEKILWYNDAARNILPPDENFISREISEVISPSGENTEGENAATVTLGGRIYHAESFRVGDDLPLLILMLSDATLLSEAEKKYEDERIAVAYIAIDNVEDILQYVHEKFKDAVAAVDDRLKKWAQDLHGVIKSYENDKYIMFFESKYLDALIENRFDILDEIRDTRLGDGVSITVSIGVSRIRGTLADREAAAREAIDLALQRGGDQAVYKSEEGITYYGGRTKSVYKRSNVRSRSFTNQLTAMMARADNVIIMGHRYGDFDSFGASVGLARLSALCGTKTNIAIDMRDKNLEACIRMMQSQPSYAQTFVDNAEGLDLVTPDTLLIIADVNTLERSQFPDIAAKVGTIAVVDHHRKVDRFPEAVKLAYVEPSASSACELVTEMIQNAINSQNLLKEEADILLSGILLDTKQFTRNTGIRTFGAAQYLRGAGASPSDVYALFKTDPQDLSKESRFHTNITIYRGNIAISACDGETDESYRVIASKAADKMLTLRGIEAAFTLVRIGDQIHISGRSNGKINVQLILEKLNGGGHFDVAGAQVISNSVLSVLETLKSAIDDYLES